ncbi:MAG: hypothetical protein ACFFFC_12510 [Candidatus Thorarchaeota archaeon]
MQRQLIVATILVTIVASSTMSAEPVSIQNGSAFLLEDVPYPAQEEAQYNVSSYYDFALATSDIMIQNLVDAEYGTVFHLGLPDWSATAWTALGGSIPVQSLVDYYWAIASMSRVYNMTESTNTTLSEIISRVAFTMNELFLDSSYPGYFVYRAIGSAHLSPAVIDLLESKRAGIQAYAYFALSMAEDVNSTLDFTAEKASAISALTDILYDETYGGLSFIAYRNGTITDEAIETYPNSGKRLDHLALGAFALYDAGVEYSNSTMTAMAANSVDFMISHMSRYNESIYQGLKIATNSSGGEPSVGALSRPPSVVITDLNAMAIRTLLRGYQISGNSTLLEWAEKTHDALLSYNWDQDFGAWYAETLNGIPYAPADYEGTEYYKTTEIQFQMVRAEEELYEATLNTFYIQLIIDTLDIVLSKLWDKIYEGFYFNGDREFNVFDEEWQYHYTGVQALGMLALERVWSYGLPVISYVRVTPTNPRPIDEITFLATVLDADGVDTVIANCSVASGGVTNTTIIELDPSPGFGGVYNSTINSMPDGTQVNFVIIANDTLGKVFVAGSYYFAVREDIWEPVVLLRTVYPSNEVRVGDNVIVEFGTYEFPTHCFLESLQLYWKVNDGLYEPKNLTLFGADEQYLVWQAELGRFAEGDVVSYYCVAEDESGNVGESAFYRLTILGPPIFVTPWSQWQTFAAIGLVVAPGIGYGITRIRRERAQSTQRELKKEARKKSTKKRPRRRRSTRGG